MWIVWVLILFKVIKLLIVGWVKIFWGMLRLLKKLCFDNICKFVMWFLIVVYIFGVSFGVLNMLKGKFCIGKLLFLGMGIYDLSLGLFVLIIIIWF